VLTGLLMVTAGVFTLAADEPQETAPPASEPKKEANGKTEIPELPEPPKPLTVEKPTGKLLQTTWYLVTYEANKVGYINRAFYQVDGPGKAVYRAEVRRFLKSSLTAKKADVFEDSVMLLDKDFAGVSFRTSRRGLNVDPVTLKGTVANGELKINATSGSARRTWTNRIQGRPTFGGALVFWLGSQEISEGSQFAKTVISERSGTFQGKPVALRVVQKAKMILDNKQQEAWLVSELNGVRSTLYFLRSDGRMHSSQGQNHNLTVKEVPATKAAGLDLSGEVKWNNNVMLKVGTGIGSEAFGYRVHLPSYPYMPIVLGDCSYVIASNSVGDDALIILASHVRAGDPQAVERLYSITRLLGITGEPTKRETRIDGLPATIYEVKTKLNGRETTGKFAVVVRDELGYLIGHVAAWPSGAARHDVFESFLNTIAWSTAYGREKGMWDGTEYVSYSHGYRVRLMGPGWQLPERRSGVPTNIEVASKDGSALISLKIERTQQDIKTQMLAANYRKIIEAEMPEVVNLSEKETTLGGQAAIELAYDAKAIQGQPTRTRHVLAVKGKYFYILTFVGKTSTLGATEGRFAEVIESFKFGEKDESTTPDN